MINNQYVLVVIPARGGSKGIPKKNIRFMAGQPLIAYSIKKTLQNKYVDEVVVSTEDEEIAHIAEQYGAKVLLRPPNLATDNTPLDPVICHVVNKLEQKNKKIDLIVTIQPTSPTLRLESINRCIEKLGNNKNIDTVISVANDSHLSWARKDNKFLPLYETRVNRQFLPEQYRETGGIIACRRSVLEHGTRIGQCVDLLILDRSESIDIDTEMDWWIAEKLLKRKKIVFRVDGYHEIGLGHIYRCLTLANRIIDHEVMFLTDGRYPLGKKIIEQNNYKVLSFCCHQELLQILDLQKPDILINDVLDTSRYYMELLTQKKIFLVNFEDLGEGADLANLVFNALYEKNNFKPNHYWGKGYYCLREEFYAIPPQKIKKEVKNILLMFGGSDINNYTERVLNILNSLKIRLNIYVILGLAYDNLDIFSKYSQYEDFLNLSIKKNIKNVSKYIKTSDIAFTSAGRTIYEIASIGIPTIVLAQNERELGHLFASPENGFINLGLGTKAQDNEIKEAFLSFYNNKELRKRSSELMLQNDLKSGTNKVLKIIFDKYEEEKNGF